MKVKNEADVAQLVKNDPWMMNVLRAAEELNLPDWWIGAGFLRNKIWDAIGGNKFVQSRDVDLVYFNADDVSPETDWQYDDEMKQRHPFAEWEIRNQARMHYKNQLEPFVSTEDGIAHWVETATCITVKKRAVELAFLWCHGMDDVLNLVARPIEMYKDPAMLPMFKRRVREKKWRERWPNLRIEYD